MGVEVLGAEISPEQVKVIESDDTPHPEMDSKIKLSFKQEVEEPIKSDLMDNSHEVNADTKETNEVATTNLPKDVLHEWPAPKQIHTLFYVRFRPYEGTKLKSKIEQSVKEGVGVCSSEEPDDLIHNLHYRMEHESNTLAAEKTMLKEIKQLEGTREKVIANAAINAKIQDSLGQKEAIQGQVKEELTAATEKRDKAYVTLSELRKEHDEANACFYQNRSLLSNAMVLAAKKNKAALEELCCNEVEKFMSQCSSSKAFRDDYDRRILPFLDIRNLRRDGRMRNAGEKAIREAPSNETEKAPLRLTTK